MGEMEALGSSAFRSVIRRTDTASCGSTRPLPSSELPERSTASSSASSSSSSPAGAVASSSPASSSSASSPKRLCCRPAGSAAQLASGCTLANCARRRCTYSSPPRLASAFVCRSLRSRLAPLATATSCVPSSSSTHAACRTLASRFARLPSPPLRAAASSSSSSSPSPASSSSSAASSPSLSSSSSSSNTSAPPTPPSAAATSSATISSSTSSSARPPKTARARLRSSLSADGTCRFFLGGRLRIRFWILASGAASTAKRSSIAAA
mmetsp:Transcript_41946/g.111252  ORF Transcript_41946/g.111252 Transcript_41946/m.111252 type:complete len:267 (+) Transcript_41946:1140-1940(+)